MLPDINADAHRRMLWFWAAGTTALNASMALWLVSSAATTGLPFTGGPDPETMRTGASFLAASLVLGAAASFITARDIPYLATVDDDAALALICQSLPPLITIAYASAL